MENQIAKSIPTYSLPKQIAAELFGTMFLLATVVGSGIMAETLSSGNIAIALLGNTIATGAMLVVLISALGPISGAHFNPAVTLVFWLKKDIDTRSSALFILAQIIGAVLGVYLAHAMFDQEIIQHSLKVRTGISQWISEAVATFGLVCVILETIRAKPDFVPIAVGLYITSAYWFTASTSFANPAVTFARSLTNTFAGIQPIDVLGFVAAQLIGAMIAHYSCKAMLSDQKHEFK